MTANGRVHGLWFDWRGQLWATLVTAAVMAASLAYRWLVIGNPSVEEGYLMFRPAPGILLALVILRRGTHLAAGVFAGSLLVGLLVIPSAGRALVYALSGGAHAALAGVLVRWFWPVSRPLIPSARFFSIMLVAGGVVPTFVTALPTCLLVAEARFGDVPFWTGYIQWCLGEFKGTLILTPLVLLLTRRGAFRESLSRPWELAGLVLAEVAVMVLWVVPSMVDAKIVLASVAGWGLTILIGFLVVVRCGVGGIILGNLVLATVMGQMQVHMAQEGSALSNAVLIGFHAEICFVAGLALIVAGGFYDYQRAEQALHEVSARMLNAQEDERRRLAASLHDGASQTLASALMRLRSVIAPDPRLAANERLEQVVQDMARGIGDLRRTLTGLRPEMLEQSAFADVLGNHCEQVEAGSESEVLFFDEVGGLADALPLGVREHLFRLAQEALSNAVQHGRAPHIEVTLARRPGKPDKQDWLRLEIRDDGAGFDPTANEKRDRPHLGLRVMRERALLIGARLEIESSPGGGTQLVIELPVAKGKPA
ncbi:sensor histidine kinase [Opitutaceae bacterium TAV4]|uniref:sensor histidine kinase n=1 Tax=Geminisphaera colitermitum TaxID=1148786 RepID=UPI000158CCC9|nr:ATP-binding protein [Geminisphaera colitermitum]RRJ96765.1 sensor histidine kinase [Opitutaceae bacterium TAV4]RRK00870.1 sensor histidine kinase [Opitutaceae bacterium TAV3]